MAKILARTPGISVSPTAVAETAAGLPLGTPDEVFDLVGERNGRPLLVAVKSQTPQTRARLAITTDRLQAATMHYQTSYFSVPDEVPQLLEELSAGPGGILPTG